MARLTHIILAAVLSLGLLSCSRAQETTGEGVKHVPVPQKYRALYDELATKLDHLGKGIRSQWNGKAVDSLAGRQILDGKLNQTGERLRILIAPNQ